MTSSEALEVIMCFHIRRAQKEGLSSMLNSRVPHCV